MFQTITQFLHTLFNPDALQSMLVSYGWIAYVILACIIFAETGLLVGFFLPGDSLLFITGFLCSAPLANGQPALNLWIVIPLLSVMAIAGDAVGYLLGRHIGIRIFTREDSWLLNKKHLIRTEKFYAKYGGRTIIYARFVPIVRTFAPFVAGMARMGYSRFFSFNVFGGIGWIVSMTLLGFWFGQIPFVKRNLEKAVLLVIFISLLPILLEVVKGMRERKHTAATIVAAEGNQSS